MELCSDLTSFPHQGLELCIWTQVCDGGPYLLTRTPLLLTIFVSEHINHGFPCLPHQPADFTKSSELLTFPLLLFKPARQV